MANINLTINGEAVSADVADNTLLVEFIRENLKLTGTHIGCDTSQCGACVVHLDGSSVKSCTMLAVQADGSEVTTIEGIGSSDNLHPMQQAFHENHGLQCGYCTPGMIMSAIDFVSKNKNASESEIREALEGNICRCTGYHNIVKSVQAAAEKNVRIEKCQKELRMKECGASVRRKKIRNLLQARADTLTILIVRARCMPIFVRSDRAHAGDY